MSKTIEQLRHAGVKCTAMRFTLIELLVSSTLSSLHFFEQKFFRTAGHDLSSKSIPLFLKREVGFGERGKNLFSRPLGGSRKNSPFASLGLGQYISQRIPLFLKEKGGAGERENSPFSSLGLGQYISQRVPLFLKREVGFGERGKTSFPVK